jgi:hypothetical protein
VGLWQDTFGELVRWAQAPSDPTGVAFDAVHGTETRWFDFGNYEPSRPTDVDAVLDALDLDLSRYTFVDLGSGKGRAVLIASQRPFARAVGIEHSGLLHASAQRNLEAAQARTPSVCPVHLFKGDAATHPLPEGPLVVYLYNPFGHAVLGAVLARLHKREAWIAYVNPFEALVVESFGWTRVRTGGEPPHAWIVYRPPGGADGVDGQVGHVRDPAGGR